MRQASRGFYWALAVLLVSGQVGLAADQWGLAAGKVELKSAGPMVFGPNGILIVGDTLAATLVAIDTDDAKGEPGKVSLNVDRLDEKLASLLGTKPESIKVTDMVANPLSGNVYVSVAAIGEGAPTLVKINAKGELSKLALDNARSAKVVLPNPPEDKVVGEGPRRSNKRGESITDLAYVEGKVIVSGLSNAAASSTVREIAFPFKDADDGIPIEIYHAAHGRSEDNAVVRAFVPFTIGGEPALLAGFTCTPLVKIPLNHLAPGKKTRGTTVAELGNRNKPLDMIVYKKDGKDFLLMANSARGVMKISTEDLQRSEGLTTPVGGGGTAGQAFETIASLQGVVQLDRLNDRHAIVLVQGEGSAVSLKTIELP